MERKLVKCNKCGWVHFEVSEEEAFCAVDSFNAYYDKLSAKKQQDYYGGRRATIERYKQCLSCGNDYRDFSDAKPGECPVGSTLNPIMAR